MKRSPPWRCTLADLALETTGLCFWYQPDRPVLQEIDVRVPRGQFLAIVGANGSGKTTLVKHFNGLLRPGRGAVRVYGQETAGRNVGELARHVGFLFQHPEQQIFSASIRREVAFAPQNLGLSSAEVEARVDTALARFDLGDISELPPAILSYGIRRQVTLASLAAMDPPILVLDEPTVGLDARGIRETFAWLRELHASGRTIVLVTHDMNLVVEYAERALILSVGKVLGDGQPADLFRQPDLLARASLRLPPVMALAEALRPRGLHADALTVEAFCQAYAALLDPPPASRSQRQKGSDGQGPDREGAITQGEAQP
jgi:energy-coupling factor transporter ATP-binding protein EcfA2